MSVTFRDSLTLHHLLEALSHDVNVVDVVELVDQIAVVVGALVSLTSRLVSNSIDLNKSPTR